MNIRSIISLEGWKPVALIFGVIAISSVAYTFIRPEKVEVSQVTPQNLGNTEVVATSKKQIVFYNGEGVEAFNLLDEAIKKGWTGTIKNYNDASDDAILFKALYAEIEKNIPPEEKAVMMKRIKSVIVLEELPDLLGAGEKEKVEVVKQLLVNYKTKGEIINIVKNTPLQ